MMTTMMTHGTNDSKEQALELACQAYSHLVKAGIPEHFIPMLSSISDANLSTFFSSFGGDSGFFLDIENVHSSLTPVRMSFGVRHGRRSLWSKISDILTTGWKKFRNEEETYEIYLGPEDITRLKDLLRML